MVEEVLKTAVSVAKAGTVAGVQLAAVSQSPEEGTDTQVWEKAGRADRKMESAAKRDRRVGKLFSLDLSGCGVHFTLTGKEKT